MAEPKKKRYPEASVTSHAVTGGLEGAAGIYAVEPALERFKHPNKGSFLKQVKKTLRDSPRGHLKKISIGALAGAAATAPIGLLIEEIRRKQANARARKKAMTPEQLAAEMPDVTELRRKIYAIEDDPEGDPAVIKLPGDSKARAALVGGLTGGTVGGVAGAGLGVALPGLAKRYGGRHAVKMVGKLEQGLGGKSGARTRTALALAGGLFHVGATVGATQAVESHNEDVARSKAIARALRKARAAARGKQTDFERLLSDLQTIEFDYIDARLKSGYRLDKYQKTIRAHEIDRKTGNYARAITYGTVGGIALPTKGSLKQRAIMGAAAGTGLTAALHFNSPKDEYGEQSEAAKIVQRRVIQGAGAAAALAGIISRKRQIGTAIRKVAGLKPK